MSTYDNDDGGRQEAIDDSVISNIVRLVATCVDTSRRAPHAEEPHKTHLLDLFDTSCEAVVDIFSSYPRAMFLIDSLFLAADENYERWGGGDVIEDAAKNAIDLQEVIDSLTSKLPLSSYAKSGASK